MAKNSQINNDEINFIELIQIVWEGKWKIAAAVVISFIAVISYQSIQTLQKTKNFTAITEIKPIGSLEVNKFFASNNLIINTGAVAGAGANTDDNKKINIAGEIPIITSLGLSNMYLDILKDGVVFEDAMHKFNLLEASQYSDEQKYNEAIIRLAASIKILSPPAIAIKENLETYYPTIHFTYHDAKKWKSVLKYVDVITNKLVKKKLLEDYSNTLSFLKQNKEHRLEDLKILIANTGGNIV